MALPRKMWGHPYSVSATPICLPICQSFLFFSLSAAVAFPWSGFKRRMQDCYISIRQHGHLTTLCKLVSQAKGTGIYWQDTLCWIVRNDLKKKRAIVFIFFLWNTNKHDIYIKTLCLHKHTVSVKNYSTKIIWSKEYNGQTNLMVQPCSVSSTFFYL